MSGLKKMEWLAGGGAARVAGYAQSPRWGQLVRRCAAPRQIYWFRMQGRAVCVSHWRTQREHAVAGSLRYLWADGDVAAWGLAVCAWWQACLRCLRCWCIPWLCRARWMVHGRELRSCVGW